MKLTNKILEAVNRGIKFALDDFDDQEEIQGQTNSKVKYQGGTKEYLDLMNNYVVDLGLPSGTLWCKYNLGCNYKYLNNSQEENIMAFDWYGDYYAWGEVMFKKIYSSLKYKFGITDNLTKYQTNAKQSCDSKIFKKTGNIDNLTQLLLKDDAAYKNMQCYNFKFHIPTKEQFDELLKYTICSDGFIFNYKHNGKQINNLNGYELISKINGNKIFLPTAGYKDGEYTYSVGEEGCYWTSNLYSNNNEALFLLFDADERNTNKASFRWNGLSIRPVLNL